MRRIAVICLVLLATALAAAAAYAQTPNEKFFASLTAEQRRIWDAWKAAQDAFDSEHDRYWQIVAARKTQRSAKRRAGKHFTAADYVTQHPPRSSGPKLRADIAKLLAAAQPPQPDKPDEAGLPTVSDYLEAARKFYRFVPTLTTEREFKRRYAAEALAIGLTKDQVVRVYGLETGGNGTYDMQAGINPKTKKGTAISTALGYAQLLAANSIDVLVRHGDGFISRLDMMAAVQGTPPQRAMELSAKANSLRSMLKTARSVPHRWSAHVALSKTPKGYGIHALNLDADIGPWLQVLKLSGLKDLAERSGRPALSGAEIELMNLAGPRTGLDMMEPAAAKASTANFFSRRGYYRNTIVRWKSAPELLAALDEKMNYTIKNEGAVEFAAAFDELIKAGPVVRRAVFNSRPPMRNAAAPATSAGSGTRNGDKPPSWTPFETP